MNLYERDYLKGPTEEESAIYKEMLEREKIGDGLFRKSLYAEYPVAIRHCLSLFPNNHLDIFDIKAIENIDEINEHFKELVTDSCSTERDIQRYIKDTRAHHIIGAILRGCGFNFGHHDAYLFPEVPLGALYRPDYLLIGKNSGGHEFVFVELEAPHGRITIADGEFGETFRKGIRQVEEWNRWLQANYFSFAEYFRARKSEGMMLPEEFVCYDATRFHFVVVAGLRKDFSEKTYRIAREFKDSKKIHIVHYDNLCDYASSILEMPTF